MFVAFIRDNSSAFPGVDNPESVSALKIWSCSFGSFSFLSSFRNLRELAILAYPDAGFDHLAQCTQLVSLSICHFPNAHDLAPLGRLPNLAALSLATLPSWDSSGKVQTVESLEPLAGIASLQHLELFGVRPRDRSLEPLKSCKNLKSLRCSKYPKRDVARFYAETGCSDAFCPPPTMIR
ncbi:hypothetical protein SSBR45G_64080 [Bradyrhizobium sp. SSBR45G]|uniref:hypothetical protein n=1 Tax=unclassified Bradyrhizobium TaxID=2631580 RepID=UPI002342A49F|nr:MULTISPECIES: hypothetical protein [unclassified Bradyrhizobium]GLH81499.1 hypothetical protein SSBR45G_64080 [Bradyrhizobium sp. SSBR45G]GLH88906.1 hypothetical protein SSBR45R_63670 [Bradyrhizobium sp. SSBR45R]